MDKRDTASAEEDLRARERVRYEWMLSSIAKFRVFFAGLVFAMLAFSIQFPVRSTGVTGKWCEFAAWVLLLVTGLMALRDAGGLVRKYVEAVAEGLSPTVRGAMWTCFVIAVILLGAARLAAG